MLQLGAEVVSEQSGAGAAALALLWSTEGTPPPAAATPGHGLMPSAPRRHLLYGVLHAISSTVFWGLVLLLRYLPLDDKVE